jgi:hypothetical protein
MVSKIKEQNKIKINLSNDKIRDITFFEEDISELSKQLASAEGLYNNFYANVYNPLTGGKYSNIRSTRDVAEIAKALVSLRSICVDTAFKRHQVRKNLSDIVHRSGGGEIDNNELIKEAARTIINEVRHSVDSREPKQIEEKNDHITDEIQNELDSRVNEYINNGDIKLSTNDKLIKYADHIDFEYDKDKDKFVAIDSRSGKTISNFPEERLPEKSISRFMKHEVITKTGDTYKIIGDD